MQDKFSEYGKIKQVTLKHAYAFIDYEDHESAVRAIKEMDRKTFINGEELVVEQSGREKTLRLGMMTHDCSAWREKKKKRTTTR